MYNARRTAGRQLFGGLVVALVAAGITLPVLPAHSAAEQDAGLVGVFKIQEAECSTPVVTGAYFRMIQPGGTEAGPFVTNADSPCADKSYTPLIAGKDGGLSTAAYQGNPDPDFDTTGNGLADKIHDPAAFFSVNFACSTNASDPQTGEDAPKPVIEHDGSGNLSGQTSAYSCAWNRQHFNQGSPKPDGEKPGLTTDPSGTFVEATGAYTLEWRSTIVGGPFNNFTGVWHLEGTFKGAPDVTFQADNASAGQKIKMSGDVSPASAGETVKIKTQKKKGKRYKKVDTKKAETDATGAYSYEHAPLPSGKYRARASVSETENHAAGKSGWKKFRVSGGSRAASGGPQGALGRTPTLGSNAQQGEPLYGIFKIAAGKCGAAQGIESGSYFQMTQPGGNPKTGPYVENGDSACDDKKVTPVSPGTDGGLSTSDYQPNPSPPFDKGGNGLVNLIHKPQKWFGVNFACSTNSKDPQSGDGTTVPEIIHDGNGNLSGNTSAYSCAWNGEHFNQGAPKADGSKPGNTTLLTGTYDAGSGAFEMEWFSEIKGGPFDKFTGTWHLEGTFTEGSAPPASARSSSSGSSTSSGGSTSGSPTGSTVSGTTSSSGASTGQSRGKSLANTGSSVPEGLGPVLVLIGISGIAGEWAARRRRGTAAQELRW